jgi:hypothetical protein
VGWAHGIAADCCGRDKRRNSQNCGGASSPRVVSHYARVQGARPSGEGKVRAPLKHGGAIFIRHSRKKGGPKAAPPQPTWNGRTPQGGLRRFSPFKAGPKGLQRSGCITMTPRINAVHSGAEFEPAQPTIEQTKRAAEAALSPARS